MDDRASDIQVVGRVDERGEEILTPDSLAFVEELQRRFGGRRDELIRRRRVRREEMSRAATADFLPETRKVRTSAWTVVPAPADLVDRRVEITGPPEPKMAINALNSGSRVWLADLEDANTPHWTNVISSQVALADAVRRRLTFESPEGKPYRLNEGRLATLVVRPRGWHLDERHVLVDGKPTVGAFVDFGLYFFHNARELLDRGSGPYFYLPKTESHLEARLWNEIFRYAQEFVSIPVGTIRATVLIETIPAAFEMDEILFELRDHASGLNAGRWDYLFSMIKTFRDAGPDFVLPDRSAVTMTASMMRPTPTFSSPPVTAARPSRSEAWRRSFLAGGTQRSTSAPSPRYVRTRSAKPAMGSTAPGSLTPISSPSAKRSSTNTSATVPTSLMSGGITSRSLLRSCSMCRPCQEPKQWLGYAITLTLACGTSRRGLAATAQLAFTI